MSCNDAPAGRDAPAGPVAGHGLDHPSAQDNENARALIGRLNNDIQTLTAENERLATDKRRLVLENTRLHADNDRLRRRLQGGAKNTQRTWPDVLRDHLLGNGGKTYEEVYKLSAKEENMSARIQWSHPATKFVPPQNDGLAQGDGSDIGPAVPAMLGLDHGDQGAKFFPFEKLPWQIQGRILKLILYKKGQLIHCISRLDPFIKPRSFPSIEESGDRRSGLKGRFFWRKRDCNITHDGVDPGQVLSILAVNKRLCFLGTHIFYGLNTFAFSSLGELGRFLQGSGPARVARIQHIELFWTGNQYLTAPPAEDTGRRRNGKNEIPEQNQRAGVPFSRRTHPLTWFTEVANLRTLVVHINETGRDYVRRGYENSKMKVFMTNATAGQPNQRMTWSLRCVQGMDYIYELRGMDWVRFYDFNEALQAGEDGRKPIRDWSFAEDITNATTLAKVPKLKERAQLGNLEPLFPSRNGGQGQDWHPSVEDWMLVKSIYNSSNCSYDDLRLRQLDEALKYESSLPSSSSEPSSSSDLDSGPASDSEADSRHAFCSNDLASRVSVQPSSYYTSLSDNEANDSDNGADDPDNEANESDNKADNPDNEADDSSSKSDSESSLFVSNAENVSIDENDNNNDDDGDNNENASPQHIATPPATSANANDNLRARRESTVTGVLPVASRRRIRESTTASGGLFVSPGPLPAAAEDDPSVEELLQTALEGYSSDDSSSSWGFNKTDRPAGEDPEDDDDADADDEMDLDGEDDNDDNDDKIGEGDNEEAGEEIIANDGAIGGEGGIDNNGLGHNSPDNISSDNSTLGLSGLGGLNLSSSPGHDVIAVPGLGGNAITAAEDLTGEEADDETEVVGGGNGKRRKRSGVAAASRESSPDGKRVRLD